MDKFNIDDAYYNMFLEETNEQIEAIERDLLALESGQADSEIVNSIFRMAHSIKGASATMGFDNMTSLSHDLENLLGKIRSKEISIDIQIMDVFFTSIDALKNIHQCIANREQCNIDIESLCKEIQQIIIQKTKEKKQSNDDNEISNFKQNKHVDNNIRFDLTQKEIELIERVNPKYDVFKIIIILNKTTKMKSVKCFLITNNLLGIGEVIKTNPENFEKIPDENFGNTFEVLVATENTEKSVYNNINSISEIHKIYMKNVRQREIEIHVPNNLVINDSNKSKKIEKTSIRIDVNKIDKLLNLIGEFIIDKESLNQLSIELNKKYKNDVFVNKLANLMSHINSTASELQDTIMSTRMLPISSVFNRFPRMVRDLAQKCNKKINFVIEGKETEIDKGIIEELVDPLTHLLRNSIDHGIETIDTRKQVGKEEEGLIRLSAKHKEGSIVIEIEDDGNGINIKEITKKVIEKKLSTEEKLKNLSEKEILQYIFEPGFSTANEITDISGRGVGLDVVKSNIGNLNGIIDVETYDGKGTKFIIKLPLTLAILQALLIEEDKYIFAIPIHSIIEMVRLKENEIKERIHNVSGVEVFRWREQTIPIVNVGNYFGLDNYNVKNKMFIVVVGYSDKRFGLVIDKIIGEQEIVIKSLGEYVGNNKLFGDLKGISGVSILGDGKLAQIIDINAISKYRRD